MDVVNEALVTVEHWLALLIGLLLGVFAVIEGAVRTLLVQLGVPAQFQQIALLAVAVVLIVVILRVFGGVLRLLLGLFLVLLIVHVLVPSLGH